MKIILTESQYGYLLEDSQEEILKNKFVDANVVSEEEFEHIKHLFNKMSYRVWILESIKDGLINVDDIYNYVKYFVEFERFRQDYPIRDIRKIKTLREVQQFEHISKMILSGHRNLMQKGMDTLSVKGEIINGDEIRELKSVGIKYLGFYNEYQVFEIPQKDGDATDVWEKYRSILGKCNEQIGGLNRFCTYKGYDSFLMYIRSSPLYVFYNVDDVLSPYQFHYDETGEFRDRMQKDMTMSVSPKLDLSQLTKLKKFTKFLIDKGLDLNLNNKVLKSIFSNNNIDD
jgi:hypothetical protein